MNELIQLAKDPMFWIATGFFTTIGAALGYFALIGLLKILSELFS